MTLPYGPAFALLGIYPREIKTCSHKNLCMGVHSSFICNMPKAGTTQMPFKPEYCGISMSWNMTQQLKGTDY